MNPARMTNDPSAIVAKLNFIQTLSAFMSFPHSGHMRAFTPGTAFPATTATIFFLQCGHTM